MLAFARHFLTVKIVPCEKRAGTREGCLTEGAAYEQLRGGFPKPNDLSLLNSIQSLAIPLHHRPAQPHQPNSHQP